MKSFVQLDFSTSRAYWTSIAFVLANIMFPQIFHLIPGGGVAWLPIYFFTLVGAYKYGWKVGVMIAIASPVSGYALFGMPMLYHLPTMLLKSVLLALFAAETARRLKHASFPAMVAVVLAYQIVGGVIEWPFCNDMAIAFQDFKTGIAGMALQAVGGYFMVRMMERK